MGPLIDLKKFARRREPVRTWGELKAMIEAAGVKDDDPVYGIDIGPYAGRVVVEREWEKDLKGNPLPTAVEITDDCAEVLDPELVPAYRGEKRKRK